MKEPRFQLVLVRHGLTDWNEDGRLLGRSEIPLNGRGREQAGRAAECLKTLERVGGVYSSPRLRTRQTAEILAEALGLPVTDEPGFDEVWLDERWQGKTVAELRGDEDLDCLRRDPLHQCDFIEPIVEVQERGVAAVERLRSERPRETLVIVSHGDPLRAVIAHYLGLPIADFRRLAVDNGSLSLIRFNPRGPRLVALNWGGGAFATAASDRSR